MVKSALEQDTRQRSTAGTFLSRYAAVVVLLVVYFAMALSSALNKCNTYDEISHLTTGYSYWADNDYRLNPEVGNLTQRWIALPLLFGNYQFPSKNQALWWRSYSFLLGQQFFFEEGNDADAMVLQGRMMISLLGAALCLLIYSWSRRLFGQAGGLLSLVLCIFSPTILAHGRLMTSDLAAALFFACFAWAFWTVLHKITPVTLLLSCLSAAALLLSKMSGVLLVPMAAILTVIRLYSKQNLILAIRHPKQIHRRQYLILALVIVIIHGFRYEAMNNPVAGRDRLYEPWEKLLEDSGPVGSVLAVARDHRLLPEAYLRGFAFAYKHSKAREAFFNGEFGVRGWKSFFPYCLLVKTPLPLFVILAFSAIAAFRKWALARSVQGKAILKSIVLAFYRTAPLWVLLAVYWFAAISTDQNTGHRHIIPTYAPMFILAGGAAWWLMQKARAMKVIVIIVMLALVAESLLAWPHYLAYFNQLAGGPKNGYRHLVDSSLDWGQDLPGLKRWLDRHDYDNKGANNVYLSYFGTADTSYYKIPATLLPCNPDRQKRNLVTPLTGGVYCISATMLQMGLKPAPGPWLKPYEQRYQHLMGAIKQFNKATKSNRDKYVLGKSRDYWAKVFREFDRLRHARLLAFLRQRKPDDHVGYSILIYRLSNKDAHLIMYGPSPQ